MKHNQYNFDFPFVQNPVEFTKETDKELLRYCLGATLYMPAIRPFSENVTTKLIYFVFFHGSSLSVSLLGYYQKLFPG